MPRGGHDSKPAQQHIADKHNVSKELIDDTDIHYVMRAVEDVKADIPRIAGTLRMKPDKIQQLKTLHRNSSDRLAISLMDTWLRGGYMKEREPYCLHAEQYQHASWWNLVWAVHHRNPAHAEKIAKNYEKVYTMPVDTASFDSASSILLGIDDKAGITAELEAVQHKWYEMGVALTIPTSELDAIVAENLSTQECFEEMIGKWLTRIYEEGETGPCWKLLLTAVAAPYGGAHRALAEQLLHEPGIANDDASASRAMVPKKKKSKIEDDGIFGTDVSPEIKRRFLPYTINKREKHGLALVVVNENFKCLESRKCASLDLERFEELFSTLQYRVRVEKDQTAEQMESLLKEVQKQGDASKTIQAGDDSFVCCISSHGGWDPILNTDVVFGVTGAIVGGNLNGALDIKKLAYKVLSPLKDGCPALNDKPKMFFIQACRGNEYSALADDSSEVKKKHEPAIRLPREADFLFAYATAPGKKAFRKDGPVDVTVREVDNDGCQFGSFFISSLSANMGTYAKKLPLIPVLELVSQDLAAEERNIFEFDTSKRIITTRQSPNFSSSLRGPVFFCNEARKRYKKRMLSGL